VIAQGHVHLVSKQGECSYGRTTQISFPHSQASGVRLTTRWEHSPAKVHRTKALAASALAADWGYASTYHNVVSTRIRKVNDMVIGG
jgi:hypothetical protein